MKQTLLLFGTTTLIFAASCHKDDDHDLNGSDRSFMTQATYINLAEISTGTLAAQRGTHGEVKAYGTLMINDHNNAQQELASIATAVGFTLPADTDEEHKAMGLMLSGLSGDAFDSTYLYKMVEGHDEAIALFEDENANGSNPSLKEYTSAKLPALKHHRMMADSLAHTLYP